MQKRIMLVDDESSLRRSLSLSLSQLGYDVEPCDCGITALNKIDLYKKNAVNLDTIVLDVNLPDIDGIKLGKIIKTRYPEITMMYITGYADDLQLTEIDELKSAGLLEKPFTADDLVQEIDKILQKHVKPPEEIEKKQGSGTTSAYILIRAENTADYLALYRKLYFMDHVLYCDSTRGDIDIVLLIQAGSADSCKEFYEKNIRDLEGISESIFLTVEIPVMNENIREIIQSAGISPYEEVSEMSKFRDSTKAVYSYVILEADREKLERIYPVLKLTDNVLYCDYTDGRYNLILLVYGTQFSEIDRIIENKIMNLDGILKAKRYPVVNIFEM
ncbi:MAG: response regulator [Ignavibacteriales bacterium]